MRSLFRYRPPLAMRIRVFVTSVLCTLFLGSLSRNAANAATTPNAHEFLETHCYDCHDADMQKGKFRIDNLASLDPSEAAKKWGRILSRLEAGEMPPPKKPRPPQTQIADVLMGIKVTLAAEAKARRAEGRARIRRLMPSAWELVCCREGEELGYRLAW